jgi:PAS domain S-box-containing protein
VNQLGRAREEIMALAPASILQPLGTESFSELLERGKQIAPRSLQFRSDLKRPDGTGLPVEISLQAVAMEGAAPSFVCIARDISERLMLQNRLNRSQRLESIGTLARRDRARSEQRVGTHRDVDLHVTSANAGRKFSRSGDYSVHQSSGGSDQAVAYIRAGHGGQSDRGPA